jgi:hypothetical protein
MAARIEAFVLVGMTLLGVWLMALAIKAVMPPMLTIVEKLYT